MTHLERLLRNLVQRSSRIRFRRMPGLLRHLTPRNDGGLGLT